MKRTKPTADPHWETEDLGLHSFKRGLSEKELSKNIKRFSFFIQALKEEGTHSYFRLISSPTGRKVIVRDPVNGQDREMLMFASNNYLGLANHPYVREQVKQTIDRFGVGVGGPPLLNGYTFLMREVEERLAHLKGHEEAMVFSSGYATNLGLVATLARPGDVLIYDSHSHASLYDALQMTKATALAFRHNDLADLKDKLEHNAGLGHNLFLAVEGVYSMNGDLAPLDQIVPLCQEYGASLWLDDAHGTGILGVRGSGTAEHFGCSAAIDISMGTFSKVFSVTGGFLTGSKEMINFLRYFARPYLFSASLPPLTLAAVHAGLDVIEKHPELRLALQQNKDYALGKLGTFECYAHPEAAILALKVPPWMDIRRANAKLHQMGLFLNAVEYPAVPLHKERFRISFSAEHLENDIDRLVEGLETVWEDQGVRKTKPITQR